MKSQLLKDYYIPILTSPSLDASTLEQVISPCIIFSDSRKEIPLSTYNFQPMTDFISEFVTW